MPDSENNLQNIIDVYQFFDDAVFLAAETAELGAAKGNSYKAYNRLLDSLRVRVPDMQDYEITFSGWGYAPGEDLKGDRATLYRYVEFGKGVLQNVGLEDTEFIEYHPPVSLVYDQDGDEIDIESSLLVAGPDSWIANVIQFNEGIAEAPRGTRLLADFVIPDSQEIDKSLHGIAWRGDVAAHYVMELASIEIVSVDTIPRYERTEIWQLNKLLAALSNDYRKVLQNKGFRNLSLENQKNYLEMVLSNLNLQLDVGRFSSMIEVPNVYVPDLANENFRFEQCKLAGSFVGNCVRLDCMESLLLSEGKKISKRRGNLNSYASLCLVVEVDDLVKDTLEIESNVVWVPLFAQTDDILFLEKSVF